MAKGFVRPQESWQDGAYLFVPQEGGGYVTFVDIDAVFAALDKYGVKYGPVRAEVQSNKSDLLLALQRRNNEGNR